MTDRSGGRSCCPRLELELEPGEQAHWSLMGHCSPLADRGRKLSAAARGPPAFATEAKLAPRWALYVSLCPCVAQ